MNEIIEKKIFNLLGLAQRAGKIISGELPVEKAIRSRKIKLIIIAEDASPGTKKKFCDMARFYHIKICYLLTKQSLGYCIGKDYRAILALNDAGFINQLINLTNQNDKQ